MYPSFEALKRRCAEANLKVVDEFALDEAEYAHVPEEDRPMPSIEIALPRGRRSRSVEVDDEVVAEWFLQTPFQKYGSQSL